MFLGERQIFPKINNGARESAATCQETARPQESPEGGERSPTPAPPLQPRPAPCSSPAWDPRPLRGSPAEAPSPSSWPPPTHCSRLLPGIYAWKRASLNLPHPALRRKPLHWIPRTEFLTLYHSIKVYIFCAVPPAPHAPSRPPRRQASRPPRQKPPARRRST